MDWGKGITKSQHNRNFETNRENEDPTIVDYQPDKSLVSASQDKFKHTHYVEVIKDILLKSETPLNIGLYGRWGVGKSSILSILKEELKKEPFSRGFKYLFVDAWGLSGGSLKQEVLVELNSQLKKYSQSAIEDILYNVREETGTNIKNVFKRGWPFFAMFVGLLAIAYKLNILYNLHLHLLTLMTGSTAITILSAIIKFSIGQSKRIIPRAASSYQFNQIYQNMVKKENKKLVVVIDNLDRCDDKVAVDLLGLIQTFMTKQNCINILACDDEAIVNHLKRVKGESYTEREGNEFLSKFFQVTIRIPPFIGENLDAYANELILQRSIKFDPFVKQILISGAVKNPRKINQFLNNIVALYRLAEFKEKDKRLPPGSITANTAFLTKMVVLRHEWPQFYKMLEKDSKLLDKINESFSMTPETVDPSINEIFTEEQNEGLKDFLSATQYCTVPDIRPFLRLNQETYEGEIPEIEKFQLDVNSSRLDLILEILNRSDEKGKEKYVKKMMAINDKHADEKAIPALLITTRVLIDVLNVITSPSIRVIALENIGRHLTSKLLGDLTKYDLNKLFVLINEMPLNYSDILYRNLRGLIKVDKSLNIDIIRGFLDNSAKISVITLDAFAQDVVNLFSEHESQILEIIKQACASSDWALNRFTKPVPFVIALINKIVFDGSDTDKNRLGVYQAIHNNLHISEKEAFVIHLQETVDKAKDPSLYPRLPTVLDSVRSLLTTDVKDISSSIAKLFSSLVHLATSIPDIGHKKSIFEILIQFYTKLKEKE